MKSLQQRRASRKKVTSGSDSLPLRPVSSPVTNESRPHALGIVGSLGNRRASQDEKLLTQMTPKLHSIHGLQDDRQQVISAVMELPPDVPGIRELWVKKTAIAQQEWSVWRAAAFRGDVLSIRKVSLTSK